MISDAEVFTYKQYKEKGLIFYFYSKANQSTSENGMVRQTGCMCVHRTLGGQTGCMCVHQVLGGANRVHVCASNPRWGK